MKKTVSFFGILLTFNATAGNYFPVEMLEHVTGEDVSDLSYLSQDKKALPGEYLVDLYVNGISYGSVKVFFDEAKEKTEVKAEDSAVLSEAPLKPRFFRKDLISWGINDNVLSGLSFPTDNDFIYIDSVPGAQSHFDFDKMMLQLDIPQADIRHHPAGWIPPEKWDEGVNVMFTDYALSGSRSLSKYGENNQFYLSLRNGINIGAWRLRNTSSLTHMSNQDISEERWKSTNTYLERDLKKLRSNIVVGDATTQGSVFDSYSFRGAMLYTSDEMYPDSERGFAPVINGTAYSHARIIVRQNSNIIYQTFVPPGPFKIEDVYPFGSSGDLNVTIEEENGKTRQIIVPFSSLPVLQRKGHLKYSLMYGQFRAGSDAYDNPGVFESSAFYGLTDNGTIYGGSQLANNYQALSLGTGWSLGRAGAVSLDLTQASSTLADGSNHKGHSVRFRYSRELSTLGTTLQLAGYRYSTQGFHTLDEAALKKMEGWYNDDDDFDTSDKKTPQNQINHYDITKTKKSRFQLNVSQPVGNGNFLYISGYRQNYWNSRSYSDSILFGFSGNIGDISYNLNASIAKYSGIESTDKILSASFSVPLDSIFNHDHARDLWATYYINQDENKRLSQIASISGNALKDGNLNWSVQQGVSDSDKNSGAVDLNYLSGYGKMRAGYSYYSGYSQTSYGISGAAVVHDEGVTFAQRLSDTNIIVSAPNGGNIPVLNGTGMHTDWRGYTIVPAGSVYRPSRVTLDASKLDDNIELDKTAISVIPTKGAFVKAKYKVTSGEHVLVSLVHDGIFLPFGSQVKTSESGEAIVGENGQAYLSGINGKEIITAKWGGDITNSCTAVVDIRQEIVKNGIIARPITCK
jgi:P pilus assembly protein, porin PapC